MKSHTKKVGFALTIPALLSLAVTLPALARAPYDSEMLAEMEKVYYEAVDEGYHLWHGSRADMTTNGLACGNCHPDAAASNPQTFPKYIPMFGKITTFRDMINWCIENPQKGQPLDVNGADMTAMEAYAFYLHRGKPIEPNLVTRQTTPVIVTGGTGYPRKPTGLGVDK